jgi:O-antigen/teichoic acid export membrane protein
MSARSHLHNLFINWGAMIINMTIAFFLAPFIVGTLGPVAYGVWSLLNVVAGYMGVLDLGIGSSTGRHICLYLGKNDHKSVDGTIRTSLGFFGAVGLFVVLCGAVLGILFPQVFRSVPPEMVHLAQWLMPLMALNIVLSAYGAVFRSVLTAHSRFDLSTSVDVLILTLRTAGTIWALKSGGGLVGLATVVVISNVLALVFSYCTAKHLYHPLRVWPLKIRGTHLREMLNFGLAAFFCSVTVQIVGQTDLLVAEWTVNIRAVTIYSIGATVVWYAKPFVDVISNTFFPEIQRTVGAGEIASATSLMFRQSMWTLLVAVPMNIGFMVFSEPFLRLWMGRSLGEDGIKTGALIMSILAINKLQIAFTGSYPNMFASLGRIWKITYANIAESVLNLAITLALAWGLGWGLSGIALGTLISRALTVTLVAPLLLRMEAGIGLRVQFSNILWPGLSTSVLFAAACTAIQKSLSHNTWPTFIFSIVLALVIYSAIALLILVPKDLRNQLSTKLTALYNRSIA